MYIKVRVHNVLRPDMSLIAKEAEWYVKRNHGEANSSFVSWVIVRVTYDIPVPALMRWGVQEEAMSVSEK